MTATMKRCQACGYAHFEQGTSIPEVCESCGCGLEPQSRIESLVQMQNVSLRLAQRITCDEEERQRFGYKIVTAYRFPQIADQLDRKDAEVYCDGVLLMRLSYGDAADLYRVNMGWLSRTATQPPGFNLDLEKGYWSSNAADEEDKEEATAQGRLQRVVPYVKDTKNALVMSFPSARTPTEMAGLQSAFKEAIQRHFQLEPRELAAEPVPSSADRNSILFYEASEGGAGVLRQVAEDPAVLPALARRGLEICHYDPDTLEDTARESCGRACYECLLDYGNQMDHKDLDRDALRPVLAQLARSECRPASGLGSRADRLGELRRRCDSKLELRWLDLVESRMLRLPSHAQYRIPGYFSQPDFFYEEFNAAVFIDGPPHDGVEAVRDDDATNKALMELGYIVVRFHHADDWMAIFQRHPDIFGTPRQ